MLRRHDPTILSAISIIEVGDNKAVSNAQDLFTKASVKSIAVRDADTGPNEKKQMYSFPGSLAPEKEVFSCVKVVSNIKDEFLVDFDKLLFHDPTLDHHDYIKKVSETAKMDEAHIKVCAVKWFLDAKGPEWCQEFIHKIVRSI